MANMKADIESVLAEAATDARAALKAAIEARKKAPDDFHFFGVSVTFGQFGESGIDHMGGFDVDHETGIEIINEALKTIERRRGRGDYPALSVPRKKNR